MRIFDAGASESVPVVQSRVLTVPNVISFARLLSLPFVYGALADGRATRALVLFAIFSATDWVDGYVARRFDQVSRVGQVLDPLADRGLFIAAGLGALVGGILPWWIIALVVARDVAMLAAGSVLLRRGGGMPAVTRLGKAATFVLMSAFTILLVVFAIGEQRGSSSILAEQLATAGVIAAVVLYWAVAFDYARRMVGRARP